MLALYNFLLLTINIAYLKEYIRLTLFMYIPCSLICSLSAEAILNFFSHIVQSKVLRVLKTRKMYIHIYLYIIDSDGKNI